MRTLLAALTALIISWPASINAQPHSMVCKFHPTNISRSTENPEGNKSELSKDYLIQFTLNDGELIKKEMHSQGIIETKLKIVSANDVYARKGNVIAMQSNDLMAEATLWSISFERREVAVSFGFSAHYTEGGVEWMQCVSDK